MLLTACGAVACMPLEDLDDYRSAPPPGVTFFAGAAGEGPGAEVAAPAGGAGSERPVAPTGPLSGAPVGDPDLGEPATEPQPGSARLDAGAGPGRVDAAAIAACGAGEELGPNGRCYLFALTPATWSAAREACLARGPGWDLASVRSASEAAFLGATLAAEAWIGATDDASEGTWLWVRDGSPFWLGGADGAPPAGVYANWNETEPNGGTATNCARALPTGVVSSSADAPWADLDCAQLRGAVCEGPP